MRWLYLAYFINAIAWFLVLRSTVKYLMATNRLRRKIELVNKSFYEATYCGASPQFAMGNRKLWEHILHTEDVPSVIRNETLQEFFEAHGWMVNTLKWYFFGFTTVLALGYAQRTFGH